MSKRHGTPGIFHFIPRYTWLQYKQSEDFQTILWFVQWFKHSYSFQLTPARPEGEIQIRSEWLGRLWLEIAFACHTDTLTKHSWPPPSANWRVTHGGTCQPNWESHPLPSSTKWSSNSICNSLNAFFTIAVWFWPKPTLQLVQWWANLMNICMLSL